MSAPTHLTLQLSDAPDAADLAVVDAGLHASNLAAADLDAVQPLAVFARDDGGAKYVLHKRLARHGCSRP